jgi:S1-C subfamily serine protease
MLRKLIFAAAAMAALVLSGCSMVRQAGGNANDSAREIMAKYQDAVVFVSGVAKIQGRSGQSQDEKTETTGVVVDPSGLTVVSLASFDPTGGDQESEDKGGAKSSFSDVKILLADGVTEVPAKLVLKDADLDLAFIMPEKKDGAQLPKFTYILLKKASEVKLLDQIVTLDRLDKEMDRRPTVALSRITAIVRKPRTFYLAQSAGQSLSSPVFTLDGQLLGFHLHRKIKQEGRRGSFPIILPAEDVQEVAQEALKQK